MRVVRHVGDVDSTLIEKLLCAKHPHLILCSRGGECDCMVAALDILAGRTWVVETLGAIMSAAVPIVSSGQEGNRMTLRNTRFMIHNVHFSSDKENTGSDLIREADELERYQELYCAVLGKTTRKKAKWWHDKINDNGSYYFSAKEAVRLGVVDRIV